MAHQRFDIQITRYDERGWRATFYTIRHGSLNNERDRHRMEPTPWHATQRAAWEALADLLDSRQPSQPRRCLCG